jgi:ATP-binding cassette subfamily B protein
MKLIGKNSEFGRLLQFVLPEKGRLLLGTLFLGLGSAVMLAFPQVLRVTLDEALQQKNQDTIDQMALIMLIVLVVQSGASALRYYLFTWAGERIVKNIRGSLFSKMISQEVAFFDGEKTGDLMSRINSDATILQNALSVNISMILRNAVASVGGLILLFVTSAKLTLILVLVLPPAAIMGSRFGKVIRTLSKNVQEAIGNASAVADEALNNIRNIKSFAAEVKESQHFGHALDNALAAAQLRIIRIAKFMGSISLFGMLAITCVLWLGGRAVISGELTIGTLSAYVMYTMTVAISVATLGGLWTDFMSALGAAGRIFHVLDRVPAMDLEAGKVVPEIGGGVHLVDVNFSYPQRPDFAVFERLNLKISDGEIVALVGSSGCGKSTIAALIQRFYDPQDGQVLIGGHDLKDLSLSWLRQQIGIVSQEPILMSTSIRENIAYGRPMATQAEIEHAAKLAYADEFILRFPDRFETLVGERGVQLSGGQRQRIAIARAMLKDPKILILDEATSALDAESEHLVQEALKILMKNRTVIVIAHRLSTVRDSDRVIVLDSGKIIQEGSHDILISDESGAYFNLVERQMQG